MAGGCKMASRSRCRDPAVVCSTLRWACTQGAAVVDDILRARMQEMVNGEVSCRKNETEMIRAFKQCGVRWDRPSLLAEPRHQLGSKF
jgi:hypothetical protein